LTEQVPVVDKVKSILVNQARSLLWRLLLLLSCLEHTDKKLLI
jgi:hypothetical protein